MSTIEFTVPGKPVGVNDTHVGGRWGFQKKRKAVAFAQLVAAYGLRARRAARWATTTAPVQVQLRVFFANERPDTDGPVKAVLDALQTPNPKLRRVGAGILENDRQVRRLIVDRDVDRERPRVEVAVMEIAP